MMSTFARTVAALWRNRSGAAAVEFAMIAILLFFFTFAIFEFGWGLWHFNSAEKATQLGVRLASTSWPVATGLELVDCKNDNVAFGKNCNDAAAGGVTFGTVTCTGTSGGVNCSKTGCTVFDCSKIVDGAGRNTSFTNIVTRMQGVYPLIERTNVQIIYRDVPALRWAGRSYDVDIFPAGGVVPEIEVRLVNMSIPLWLAGPIVGVTSIPMPTTRATAIGEDMNSCDQPESGATSCTPS